MDIIDLLIQYHDVVFKIVQTGAVGAMLIMVWRHMTKKDSASYKMIEEMNDERREMYSSMSDLVREVTEALTHKNTTDDKMSLAVDKLTEELRRLKTKIESNDPNI